VKTVIIEKIRNNKVEIKEESVLTGGHFACFTMTINVAANTSINTTVEFPMPITATISLNPTTNAMSLV